jgi:hypothetical protein
MPYLDRYERVSDDISPGGIAKNIGGLACMAGNYNVKLLIQDALWLAQ